MTATGDALRRPGHVRGDHPPPRHHRSVRAGRQRRHRAHRAGLDDRPAADRAGDRQHHRQVRQRHRRRFPDDALHGDARAGAARAGDEHADVRARGGAARISTRWRRAACGSSSRARAIWRAAGSAKAASPSRTRSSRLPKPMLRPQRAAPRAARAGDRRADLRRRRSGALPRQPLERPHGVCDRRRSRPSRRDASRWSPDRPRSTPPAVRRSRPGAQRRRDARRRHRARADAADVVIMAAAVADYMPRMRADQKIAKTGRHADARPEEDARHPRRPGRAPARDRPRSAAGRLRRRDRRRRRPRAPTSCARKHVDLIVANDVSRSDAGFDVETNAVTLIYR